MPSVDLAVCAEERDWALGMLAYASHILSQLRDRFGAEALAATAGPRCDPDRYDADSLLEEIRSRLPAF